MRKWSRADKLTAAGVVVAILATAVSLLVPEVRRFFRLEPEPTLPRVQGTGVSSPKNEIKIVTKSADTVEELRKGNNVSLMKETESGKPLSEIPRGSFGFANPVDLSFPLSHSLQTVQLNTQAYSGDRFEIHKLANEQIELIGYVGPETLDRVRSGLSPGEAITFFSDKWDDAPNPVSVPLGSFKCSRSRGISLDEKSKHGRLIYALDCGVD